jgi:hypothetical protein
MPMTLYTIVALILAAVGTVFGITGYVKRDRALQSCGIFVASIGVALALINQI